MLALSLTDTERITGITIPWGAMCGTTIFCLLCHVLMNYTSGLTHKLYFGLGVALGIPVCTFADYVFKKLAINGMEIAAVTFTLIGLLLVMWPDRCPAGMYTAFKCCLNNEVETHPREQRSQSHSVLHFSKG